jgi:hypothetical protein
VPLDAPFGHCPNCLLDLGFGPLPEDCQPSPPRPKGFGEYELLEQIGRGGMGVVYRARQISLNRLVALKMLGPHASAFPGIAERLRLEAEVAGGLRHPQIVTIYDVGERDGQPFFTMELVEGAGLDKFIGPDGFRLKTEPQTPSARRNGPEARIARVMVQIAQAVDYAHQHGVLHRDLKPANILIDARGEPHLTDFGLAKVLGRVATSGTATGAIMGTPAYMAPEQASGATKHASIAADIYSLGAILYEMLTGHPPFRAETPLETLRRVVEEVPKPPSTFNRNLDGDLATICIKCLEKDPRHRYGTAAAMAEDLERWLRGEPIAARSVGRLERAWRWCRREPVLAGLTGGIALLLVITSVFALTAYRVTRNRLVDSENARRIALDQLMDRINIEWANPELRFVRVQPEELGALANRPITRDVTDTIIKLGVQLPGIDRRDPQQKITKGHPALAHYLHTGSPARRLLLEIYIYKTSSNAVEGLLKGEVDLMQLNPASYVEARVAARPLGIALTPLVVQVHGGKAELHGAIIVNTNHGIDRIESLRGHNFAFADSDSAIANALFKLKLMAAGVRAPDLSGWTNTRPWHASRLVREQKFTAGAADLLEANNLIKAGAPLRVLDNVKSPSAPWIATTNMTPADQAYVQQRLVSLMDSDTLAGISRGLTGFVPTTAANYDELERQIAEARQFDQIAEPPK